MGHLYKSGLWIKKKSVLLSEGHFNTEAFQGDDYRTQLFTRNNPVSKVLPSASEADKYFFLPSLGQYDNGTLSDVGRYGHFWSSSSYEGGGGV